MRMRRGSESFGSERGASAVIIALMLVVIFGMAALAVDGGGLYMQRRRMVRATDAATLAAAQWCAQNYSAAQGDSVQSRGLTTATANVDQATQVNLGGAGGFLWSDNKNFTPTTGQCNDGKSSGYVKAKYGVPANHVFGAGLGHNVFATAIAKWGAAGGSSQVAPLMLSNGRLNDCGFNYPYSNLIIDVSQCAFFWDNGSNDPTVLGHAEWGTVDLSTWGPPYLAYNAGCPGNASENNIYTWLNGGYPGSLFLKKPPPTYVCKGVGSFGGALNNAIRAIINCDKVANPKCDILPFPINDPTQQIGKANGNYFNPCTPAMVQANTCTVDKYAMVGFASLKINALYTYQGKDQALAIAACGLPPEPLNKATNARCLVTTWEGLIPDGIGGGDPGGPGNTTGVTLGLSG